MIRSFGALAWNGFREARRNRVTVVVGVFAVLVLLSTSLVTDVTVNTFDRVLTDFGLGSMSLILTFLAIFLACGLLPREIERRTIFLMMSKPISRAQFLVARLAGNLLTLGVLLAGMTVVFVIELKLYHVPLSRAQFQACLALLVELGVLTSAGFFFSSFTSLTVSAIATTGLFLAGHLSRDIYNLASISKSESVQVLGKALYYVLPNLDRLDYKPAATYFIEVPWSTFAGSIMYGLAYASGLTALACLIFSRRDFR